MDAVARSYDRFGQRKPIVARRRDGICEVVAGNHQLLAARKLGWEKIAVSWADDLSDDEVRGLALADNRTADLGTYDDGALVEMLSYVADDEALLAATGYTQKDIDALVGVPATPDNADDVPAPPKTPVTAYGDLWLLGKHRVLCGDSTSPQDVQRLLQGVKPDAILSDPPYCSGGFQEAGRSQGSIGTDARIKPKIANDTLSTRGYQSLIRSVIEQAKAPLLYLFTDWRMWVNLFDVVEASGYGVRNMVVWDKGSPGMGMGWRTQHELVMFAAAASVKFDNHKAQGNVIATKRTGNDLHPTQKPVELLERILDVTDMARTIYDPFGGSGSTLVACQNLGRTAYLVELDPNYVDVICRRYQEQTGDNPVLESTSGTHDFSGTNTS